MSVETTAAAPEFPMLREHPMHPAQKLEELRENDPITRTTIWDGSAPWLITRFEDVRDILSDPRVSADGRRPGYPAFTRTIGAIKLADPGFISMDEPEHGYFRRMLVAPFSPRRVEAYVPEVERLVEELLDEIAAKGAASDDGVADLVHDFALPLTSKILCMILGVPYSFAPSFQAYAQLQLHAATNIDDLKEADVKLEAYLLDLFEERRKDPQDDMITKLVVERLDTGQLTVAQLLSIMRIILVGGHDTTANQIAMGILALQDFPEQAETIRTTEDREVIANAVEELLRYVTVTHLGRRRTAREDIEFHGHVIKAGEGIVAVQQSANRDPRKFSNPNSLDLTRTGRDHAAFGFGPHLCLGQHLARVELRVAYPRVLRRFPELRLAEQAESLEYSHDMVIIGPRSMPVVLGPESK